MLMHLQPRDWFFIFLGVLLCGYMKLASAKTQKPVFFPKASIAITSIFR